jgi:hypothetical protein
MRIACSIAAVVGTVLFFAQSERAQGIAGVENWSLWEVKDDKDPRIDQIQKAVQSWQQQILDGKTPVPINLAPTPTAPTTATTSAPATQR